MFSPEIARHVGEARAEWKILRELAASVYPDRAQFLGCETGSQIRQEIARVVPFYEGVQNLKKTGDAVQYGGPHLCAGWSFPTPDGKAHFRAVPLPGAGAWPASSCTDPAPDGRRPQDARNANLAGFIVSTRRGKQFNSLVYAEIDPLNGAPRDAVLMSDKDAAELELRQNDRVLLKNAIGRFEGRVFLAPIARGNLQIHWPEGNVLIKRGVTDPAGGVPDYNTRVTVQRVQPGDGVTEWWSDG